MRCALWISFFNRSADVHRLCLALALALLASGCTSAAGRPPATGPRALSPDSAALLAEAIRQAKPAFATQYEALGAGLYARVAAPHVEQAAAPQPWPTPHSGLYVVQVAAYRDRESALAAAAQAEQRFPELQVVIETTGEYFRVAMAGWPFAEEAKPALQAIRTHYPTAWLRRSVP